MRGAPWECAPLGAAGNVHVQIRAKTCLVGPSEGAPCTIYGKNVNGHPEQDCGHGFEMAERQADWMPENVHAQNRAKTCLVGPSEGAPCTIKGKNVNGHPES